MDYKICIGIPSYLPDTIAVRKQREECINQLFNQINNLWPDIDILVIAQNWQNFKPIETSNKQIIKYYDKLGILKARKILREEFLNLNYDYIIMLDDDAIINCKSETASLDFIDLIKNNPNGFCFMPGNAAPKYNPYCGAQLNLCAISRFIYSHEPMVDVDPQQNKGYEDLIFATLLHHKWSKYEFIPNNTISCSDHRINNPLQTESTWSGKPTVNIKLMHNLSNKLADFIVKYKDLPDMKIFNEKGIIIKSNYTEEELNKARIEKAKDDIKSDKNYYSF